MLTIQSQNYSDQESRIEQRAASLVNNSLDTFAPGAFNLYPADHLGRRKRSGNLLRFAGDVIVVFGAEHVVAVAVFERQVEMAGKPGSQVALELGSEPSFGFDFPRGSVLFSDAIPSCIVQFGMREACRMFR